MPKKLPQLGDISNNAQGPAIKQYRPSNITPNLALGALGAAVGLAGDFAKMEQNRQAQQEKANADVEISQHILDADSKFKAASNTAIYDSDGKMSPEKDEWDKDFVEMYDKGLNDIEAKLTNPEAIDYFRKQKLKLNHEYSSRLNSTREAITAKKAEISFNTTYKNLSSAVFSHPESLASNEALLHKMVFDRFPDKTMAQAEFQKVRHNLGVLALESRINSGEFSKVRGELKGTKWDYLGGETKEKLVGSIDTKLRAFQSRQISLENLKYTKPMEYTVKKGDGPPPLKSLTTEEMVKRQDWHERVTGKYGIEKNRLPMFQEKELVDLRSAVLNAKPADGSVMLSDISHQIQDPTLKKAFGEQLLNVDPALTVGLFAAEHDSKAAEIMLSGRSIVKNKIATGDTNAGGRFDLPQDMKTMYSGNPEYTSALQDAVKYTYFGLMDKKELVSPDRLNDEVYQEAIERIHGPVHSINGRSVPSFRRSMDVFSPDDAIRFAESLVKPGGEPSPLKPPQAHKWTGDWVSQDDLLDLFQIVTDEKAMKKIFNDVPIARNLKPADLGKRFSAIQFTPAADGVYHAVLDGMVALDKTGRPFGFDLRKVQNSGWKPKDYGINHEDFNTITVGGR